MDVQFEEMKFLKYRKKSTRAQRIPEGKKKIYEGKLQIFRDLFSKQVRIGALQASSFQKMIQANNLTANEKKRNK